MPLKIPVGRIGEWKHPRYGLIKMSQQTFDQMIANFAAKTIGRDPFVRIGHDKSDDQTFGSAKAEGWIKELVQEGNYLYALADPTNADVAEMVRSKQYRYASPEYQDNYKSKEDGSFKGAVLEALALTNEPFLTRLPEARLLSDPPETFYLDHEEAQTNMEQMTQLLDEQKKTNGLLTKLADFFSGKKPEPNPDPTPTPAAAQSTEEQKKLSDQIAALEAQINAANATASTAVEGQRAAEINKKLSDYVTAGIPPIYVENARKILLGDQAKADDTGMIKLSDTDFTSQTAQVYAMLDAFPESARVRFSQIGTAHTPPAAGSPEDIKKLADQDMAELGFRVDEQGRYVL